jgi:hypothetical protein
MSLADEPRILNNSFRSLCLPNETRVNKAAALGFPLKVVILALSMDDIEVKQVLCMVLAFLNLASFLYCVRLQVQHFNSNRFLELSYYLISFYFASTSHTVRLIFVICFAFTDVVYLILILRFAPVIHSFMINSMLAYLW